MLIQFASSQYLFNIYFNIVILFNPYPANVESMVSS